MKYTIQKPPLIETFYLPSRDKLLSLKPEDIVKIIFQTENEEAERMWVKITQQPGSAEWKGVLDNDPYGEKLRQTVKAGDEVVFIPSILFKFGEMKRTLMKNNYDKY